MTDNLLVRLSAPFPPATVSWRIGPTNADKTRGLALAYIDARDVQDRLNEVCGTDWQVRFPWAIPGKMTCEIGIKIPGDWEWVWRGDGAGDSDVEAEKGAFSDAFKRAAVRWGIGRYLYDVDAPWVAVEKRGNSVFIPDNELARLRAILMRPAPLATRDAILPHTGEPETLSQIRDRIHRALSQANEKLTPDQIIKINKADLALIKDASEKTYDNLLSYAEQRKAELVQPPPSAALEDKVAERLGA